MKTHDFIQRYPRLFHMAEEGAWPSIRATGLSSTSALLDHLGYIGEKRLAYESLQRARKTTVSDIGGRDFVLRDQRPMAANRLEKVLQDGLKPRDWYELINGRVFFWVEEKRLIGLLNSRDNRDRPHDVLVVDTTTLLAKYADAVLLTHMNTGNTFPFPQPRGLDTFVRIADWPARPNGTPDRKIVELTVKYAVPDIADHVLEVRKMHGERILSATPIRP